MPKRLPGAFLLAALAAAASASPPACAPAHAQVTVNPGALDLLPTPKPAAPKPHAREPRRQTPRHTQPTTTRKPEAAKPETPKPETPTRQAQPTPPPPVPTIPPAVAALPPPAPIPPPRSQPAPTIPVAPDAPGTATPIQGGTRITFGPNRQDLNPTTEAALRTLAHTLLIDPATTVNLYAYAAGAPEDPSTPRRLALGRALAARAVLIHEGIASTRIYPRALGPAPTTQDPDRVDVVTGPPGPPKANTPP